MKTILLFMFLFFCAAQLLYSQEEDGVVGLEIPVRNSLTFNRFSLSPTFSFVREQNKYITVYNKSEMLELEDTPQTYLASYSGRVLENVGIGLGVFQQDYGILTTFGGMANFAYNAALASESNLTLGVNVGAYKSGVNNGRVISNNPDPSLNTIPSNFLLTLSPGINYGSGFMDFGITVNNLVAYNFNSSKLIENNPKQGFQGHLMYTGYLGGYGFFEDSKFSALGRTEFRKDATLVSGTLMLTVPKGFWFQGGYNTMYGASGGLGLNITSQIAIEYNYEKSLGGLADFGSSHEITLAYRFKNNNYFNFSNDDEIAGLISFDKKRKNVAKKAAVTANTEVEQEEAPTPEIENLGKSEAQIKFEEEKKARTETEAVAQSEVPSKQVTEGEGEAKIAAETLAKAKAEEQTRLAAEELAKTEADKKARLAAEALEEAKAQEQTRIASEALAKAKAEEQTQLAAEALAKEKAKEQTRIAAEALAKAEADEKVRLASEAQVRLEAEEQGRLATEARVKQETEEQTRLASIAQARFEVEELARLATEALVKQEAEAKAKSDAEEKARLAAVALAKVESEIAVSEEIYKNPTDELGQSIQQLVEQTDDSKSVQTKLVSQLAFVVANKDRDLKDLKRENDLSEQGIFVEPKPFKSITEENNEIETLKINLDAIIITHRNKINQLESLLQDRIKTVSNPNDETNLYYRTALAELKAEQDETIRSRATLVSSLEAISIATEVERKRRIKRAKFDSEEDRYRKDMASLVLLKQNTAPSETALSNRDFDFGEIQNNNIQILKNVENTENGYYLVLAIHSDTKKRDEFVTKAVASGLYDVNYFYNVNTSKYYIYHKKVNAISEANEAIRLKHSKPYTEKLSIIKIENR